MFRELLSRESRFPPLLGTGLAAVLMGSVAFASAQASLPSRTERLAAEPTPVAAPAKAVAQHVAVAKFAFGEPLPGYAVNSPFGLRKMPWEEGGRLHEGVDIAAPIGASVRATLAGVVVRSGDDGGGYGRFIEVAHEGGLTSFYAHLGRVAALKPGTAIAAGDVVGYVGSSGRSTGSHLHFEIRLDGQPLNPTAFLGQTFLSQADLPLTSAARISRSVRIAQVSNWPQSVLGKRGPVAAATVTVADSNLPGGRVRAVIAPTDPSKPIPYRLAQYQRLQAMTAKAQAEQGTRSTSAMPVIERMAPAAAPSPAPAKAPSADHDIVVTS